MVFCGNAHRRQSYRKDLVHACGCVRFEAPQWVFGLPMFTGYNEWQDRATGHKNLSGALE
jgi:hypothetical protein